MRLSLHPLALCTLAASGFLTRADAAPEAPLTKWVVAEGMGTAKDKGKARDDAVTDALRRAIEHGVGLYVSAETLVANAELVRSEVCTKAEGLVIEHEVTDEAFEGDDLCRVKVRAKLFLGKLKDALGGICSEMKLEGNPKVLVAIDPPVGGDETTQRAVVGALRQRLVEQRIGVVDLDQLGEERRKQARQLRRDGERATNEALDLVDQVDLVIKGTVTTRALGKLVDGLDAITGEATVDLWAAWTDNGRVIASQRCQAKKAAFRQEQATERAVVAAVDEWANTAMCQLKLVCADPARTYQLTVAGLADVDALDWLTQSLGGIRFVRQVRERGFADGTASLDVEYVGPPHNLRSDLQALESPKLKVESFTGRTMAVRYVG